MIPPFNEHGSLPDGVYHATLDEVIARFDGPSMMRKQLLVPLREFFHQVEPVAVEVYLVGSFVTAKIRPEDVDFYIVFPDKWVDRHLELAHAVYALRYRRGKKKRTLIHCTWCYRSDRKCRTDLMTFFRHAKDGRPKGIIRIVGR